MKIAIIGSRTLTPLFYETMRDYILTCMKDNHPDDKIEEVISGGARGADALGEKFSLDVLKKPCTVFPAEWEKYGRSAGYRRNSLIINAADVVFAFWDGVSNGTKHSIELAVNSKKPVYINRPTAAWFEDKKTY